MHSFDFNEGGAGGGLQRTVGPSIYGSQACYRALRPEVPWATGLSSVKDKASLFAYLGMLCKALHLSFPYQGWQPDIRQTSILLWVPDSEHPLSVCLLSSWALSLPPLSPPYPAANNQLLSAAPPPPSPAGCQSARQQGVEGSSTPR